MINTREPTSFKSNPEKNERSGVSLLEKWRFVYRIQRDPELSGGAKRVAIDLMYRTNCKRETCFPKQSTIADSIGLSRSKVVEACQELKARGWIWVRTVQLGVNRHGNLYGFNWEFSYEGERTLPDEPQEPDQGEGVGILDTGNVQKNDTAKRAVSRKTTSQCPEKRLQNTGKVNTGKEPSLTPTAPEKDAGASSDEGLPSFSAEVPLQLVMADGTVHEVPPLGLNETHWVTRTPELTIGVHRSGSGELRYMTNKRRELGEATIRVRHEGDGEAPPKDIKDEVWRVLLRAMQRKFKIADKVSRGRMAALVKASGNDLNKVRDIIRATLANGPSDDPFDYAAGILRRERGETED